MSELLIDENIIARFDRPGPRYTSYPTAPEWNETVGPVVYRDHLRAFGRGDGDLAVYVHVPFCASLCYFCACTTNIRSSEIKAGDEYLDYLKLELGMVITELGRGRKICQLHWGGGTPSFLNTDQLCRLHGMLTDVFVIKPDAEVAAEVDPRRMTESKVRTLKALGFNRISIGVQDLDRQVQEQINRVQPYAVIAEFNRWCREAGFGSVNFDLVYGLPAQTPDSFAQTVEKVARLRPDRIALYSFAWVPWVRKHQRKISESLLPSPADKLGIFLAARAGFLRAGYEAIAMDHFALATDELARSFRCGRLYRNFMGYTVSPVEEYLGLGASSIGFLGSGYFHNQKNLPAYYKALDKGDLPVERGLQLSADDLRRRWVINRWMCRFELDRAEFTQIFGQKFDVYFVDELVYMAQCAVDGLITDDGKTLRATPLGRIFIRIVCMGFDAYLKKNGGAKQFSRTV